MPGTSDTRNKWALLIGIDEYPYLSKKYRRLYGCVNDVDLMYCTLRDNFGFPENNIVPLTNRDAYRKNILAHMHDLAECISGGDIVVVHYSGHGSCIRDRESDEHDRWDETILPCDTGRRPRPNRDITDDEIYVWLLELTKKTSYVTLVFDSCHSGTIDRDAFGVSARWAPPDDRPRKELPPSSVRRELAEEARRDVGPSGWLPLGKPYVLIAACQDDEEAQEYPPVGRTRYGALTYFLTQELIKAGPGTTYSDVFQQAKTMVTTEYPRQHPQLEGAWDRELFGVRDIEPMRFVSVRQRVGDKVTLAAGAAHGMSEGSQWAVYSQEAQHVTEETIRLGLVEITDARAVTSDAKIVEESEPDAIVEESRAVEEAHSYGEMRIVVDIKAPAGYEKDVLKLAEQVKASGLLRQAEAGETANVRAYIIAPRTEINEGDPVPQLGNVGEAVWAVVGQDGRLVGPTHRVDEEFTAHVLCSNMEKRATYRQALALRNSNDDSILKGKVEFILKRQAADGAWVLAEPEDDSGQVVFEDGERIAIEIINHHDTDIYVSVLDFGLTGKICSVYPYPEGPSEWLSSGASIVYGEEEHDQLPLRVPEDFPYEGGTETFKLLATTGEANFSPLLQEKYRRRLSGNPLVQLLRLAMRGKGTRSPRRNRVPSDEEWTTVERSFFLRRKA